jgi:hypothetical protein
MNSLDIIVVLVSAFILSFFILHYWMQKDEEKD